MVLKMKIEKPNLFDNHNGFYVPLELIEILGHSLAMKISAFYAGCGTLSINDVNQLKQKDVCEEYKLKEEDVVKILKSKIPQSLDLDLGLETCAWCLCQTAELHKHHYPIPKAKGGKETISICPNCHTEYHNLVDRGIFRIKPEFLQLFKEFYVGRKI